jgi:hypothetical protein
VTQGVDRTYNPPSVKTSINDLFCLVGRFRFFKTGIGNMTMAKSVAMFKEAFVNQAANWFMHLPPSIVLSQKYATG